MDNIFQPAKMTMQLQAKLEKLNIDGILLFDQANIRYLTGFKGENGVLFIDSDQRVLLVDGRFTTQARQEVLGFRIVEFKDTFGGIADILAASAKKTIGFESQAITYDAYIQLTQACTDISFSPLGSELANLRAKKSFEEIEHIRKAAMIASQALKATIKTIFPGLTEKEIALALDYEMRKQGGERPSFETIIASGANGALPHAIPTSHEIVEGELLIIDYGTVYEGYCSDETCTFAIGHITAEQQKCYDIVLSAHDKALDAVKEGMACRDIDAVARQYIDDAGMGQYFVHGTGHGVGLNVHEPPRLSSQSKEYLEEGMVVTVEPGIYIPERWGIRIEDTVLVKKDGCEILTKTPKNLTILCER